MKIKTETYISHWTAIKVLEYHLKNPSRTNIVEKSLAERGFYTANTIADAFELHATYKTVEDQDE